MRWVQLCSSLSILWDCLSLGWEWKLTFSSPAATAEFSKCAGILSAALSQHHLLGFEIARLIPSPPLALFVVMLPKAHLTSHSRMSGSRWVITPLWLSGLWRSFLYSSSVYQRPDPSKLLAMCFWNENRGQMEKGWGEEEEVTKKEERKEREIEQSFGKPASWFQKRFSKSFWPRSY